MREGSEEALASAPSRLDEHFDRIRANLIRCEECNENFFFDFLRHPRYFVTHFKVCHLKNVLYRFNGCSEEENQRIRFGPRRKKDATAWFGQLKSTEKRMISMQDNKWGEIAEKECWACRLCKHARKASDLPHAFEPNELGRRQALLHLRRLHEGAYNAFLCSMPAVDSSAGHGSDAANSHTLGLGLGWSHDSVPDLASDASSGQQSREVSGASRPVAGASAAAVETTSPAVTQRRTEAQRSRLRRMRATPEARKAEAERSKRRREQLTPAQRQADAERRARKRQRAEERARSRARRAEVSPESREREVQRSRDRRKNATELQRRREAQRSRERRQHASEEQVLRERERCRRRYEAKKRQNPPPVETNTTPNEATWQPPAPAAALPSPSARTSVVSTAPSRGGVQPVDLERRSQQLLHQQAGLGLQLQSLYASLAVPPRPPRG